jgi:hypothetical protein
VREQAYAPINKPLPDLSYFTYLCLVPSLIHSTANTTILLAIVNCYETYRRTTNCREQARGTVTNFYKLWTKVRCIHLVPNSHSWVEALTTQPYTRCTTVPQYTGSVHLSKRLASKLNFVKYQIISMFNGEPECFVYRAFVANMAAMLYSVTRECWTRARKILHTSDAILELLSPFILVHLCTTHTPVTVLNSHPTYLYRFHTFAKQKCHNTSLFLRCALLHGHRHLVELFPRFLCVPQACQCHLLVAQDHRLYILYPQQYW